MSKLLAVIIERAHDFHRVGILEDKENFPHSYLLGRALFDGVETDLAIVWT
jgi:hypothetical protein